MRISREFRYGVKKFIRSFQRPVFQVAVAAICAFAAVFLFASPLGVRLELALLGAYFDLRGPLPPPKDVVIVGIDDRSYQELKASTNYPLPRRHIAQALETINAAEPKLVMLDAKIPEERLIDPQADARIEAALAAGRYTIWSGEIPSREEKGAVEIVISSEERFRKAAKMELPMTVFLAAGQAAFVRNPAVEQVSPDAPERAVWMARPLREIARTSIDVPGRFDFINYYGPARTITRLSLVQLVTGDTTQAKQLLHDKIVLIGYQSIDYGRGVMGKDEFVVPVSKHGMFGVEVHANVLGNLLERSWIRRADFLLEVTVVLLAVFVMASYMMRSPRPVTIGLFGAIYAAALVVSYIVFVQSGFWISGLPVIGVSLLGISILSAIYFALRSEAYRRYLDTVFGFEREREL